MKKQMKHEAASEHLVYLYRKGASDTAIMNYAKWLSEQFEEHGVTCRIEKHGRDEQYLEEIYQEVHAKTLAKLASIK